MRRYNKTGSTHAYFLPVRQSSCGSPAHQERGRCRGTRPALRETASRIPKLLPCGMLWLIFRTGRPPRPCGVSAPVRVRLYHTPVYILRCLPFDGMRPQTMRYHHHSARRTRQALLYFCIYRLSAVSLVYRGHIYEKLLYRACAPIWQDVYTVLIHGCTVICTGIQYSYTTL